jgi:hypothetical protein
MESIEAAERGDGERGAAEPGGGKVPDAWREAIARMVPTHLVEFVAGKRARDVEPNAGKRARDVAPNAGKPGRPPTYKWELIEPVIDFFLSARKTLDIKEEAFIEAVRDWCRESNEDKVPDRRTIEKRIHARARAK